MGYSLTLGRFVQRDPIGRTMSVADDVTGQSIRAAGNKIASHMGSNFASSSFMWEYGDGGSVYEYLSGDPAGFVDPSGLGLLDWVMTGDWDPSDEQIEAANQGYVDGWGSFGIFDGSIGQWLYTGDWDPTDDVVRAAATIAEMQQFMDCWSACMADAHKHSPPRLLLPREEWGPGFPFQRHGCPAAPVSVQKLRRALTQALLA